MTVDHKKVGGKDIFYVEYEDEVAAQMVCAITSANKMLIEHTEVDDVLRGRNIGFELVHASVEYARHHELKIIALCSFAKAVMDKKPEWMDVVER